MEGIFCLTSSQYRSKDLQGFEKLEGLPKSFDIIHA